MKIFNGDVIKFICCNVHNNKNVVYYGVCLNKVDVSKGDKIKYLNLYNDCVSNEESSYIVSISLIGNITSIFSKIRLFVDGLNPKRKDSFMNECEFLIKERNRGKIYNHTKNKDLDFISSVINCTPLVTACIILNKGSINWQCAVNSVYSKIKQSNKPSSKISSYSECYTSIKDRSC